MDNQRIFFARQPAHILLIDFSSGFNVDACQIICDVLVKFFSLICNLAGPCRAPLLGLIALARSPEVIFPLQSVRGSYNRLCAALTELGQLFNQRGQDNKRCIAEGLEHAVNMFKKQSHVLMQHVAGPCCQLEVMILTCQNAITVGRMVENVIKDLELDSLKKVQLACLQCRDQVNLPTEDPDCNSITSSQSSSTTEYCGVTDTIYVDNDPLSIENLFKSWLHDAETDSEHLHLLLPPEFPGGPDIRVKCDLQERILSPTLLPYNMQTNFAISTEHYLVKQSISASGNKGATYIPIHTLKVIKLIPANCICESVIFGTPSIVRATTCWKIDWDELETNQQTFQSLCHILHTKDLVIIASLKTSGPTIRNQKMSLPTGHFVLLACGSKSLLLKPIAVKELLLPCEFAGQIGDPSTESLDAVQRSLDNVEFCDTYNPLRVSSELYGSLCGVAASNKVMKPTPVTTNQVMANNKTQYHPRSVPVPYNQKRVISTGSLTAVTQSSDTKTQTSEKVDKTERSEEPRPFKRHKLFNATEFYKDYVTNFPTEL